MYLSKLICIYCSAIFFAEKMALFSKGNSRVSPLRKHWYITSTTNKSISVYSHFMHRSKKWHPSVSILIFFFWKNSLFSLDLPLSSHTTTATLHQNIHLIIIVIVIIPCWQKILYFAYSYCSSQLDVNPSVILGQWTEKIRCLWRRHNTKIYICPTHELLLYADNLIVIYHI